MRQGFEKIMAALSPERRAAVEVPIAGLIEEVQGLKAFR